MLVVGAARWQSGVSFDWSQHEARRKGSLTAPPLEWLAPTSDAADWADLEVPDTDFEWTPYDPDNPIRDRESIEIVEKLWAAAMLLED